MQNQSSGNFDAQGQPPYQPPPQQPGYGPPPGQPGYGPPPGQPGYGPPPGPMGPAPPMGRPSGVTILAVLFFIMGIMWLLFVVILSVCLASMFTMPGVPENAGDDIFAGMAMCWIIFGVIALLHFLVGFGLLKGQGWARIVAIILAIIGLLNIPIGTIISIIILLYLFKPDVKAYFV